MTTILEAAIPDRAAFCTLYADGLHMRKIREGEGTVLFYPRDSVVFLYYTYPTYREALAVRNTPDGGIALPRLSKKVSVLFRVRASRVDKLKRAVGFVNANCEPDAYSRGDGFYVRLAYVLERRGKICRTTLGKIADGKRNSNDVILLT